MGEKERKREKARTRAQARRGRERAYNQRNCESDGVVAEGTNQPGGDRGARGGGGEGG